MRASPNQSVLEHILPDVAAKMTPPPRPPSHLIFKPVNLLCIVERNKSRASFQRGNRVNLTARVLGEPGRTET